MRKICSIAAACMSAAALHPQLASAKDKAPPPELGPPPDWQRFREIGEAAVKAQLIDPDSARITWPNAYRKGVYKPLLMTRVYGYVTCGMVNSRSRMGGYVGDSPFIIVIDNDAVSFVEISGSPNSFIASTCASSRFPSASTMASSASASPSASGLELTEVPDGAYISSVDPGSTADRAGLKPGMVVSHINGVAIHGMDLATVRQLLARSEGRTRLTIIGGATLEIESTKASPSSPPAATPKKGSWT